MTTNTFQVVGLGGAINNFQVTVRTTIPVRSVSPFQESHVSHNLALHSPPTYFNFSFKISTIYNPARFILLLELDPQHSRRSQTPLPNNGEVSFAAPWKELHKSKPHASAIPAKKPG